MRDTYKVAFFIKRNAPLKTGRYPVIARITINKKTVEFRTKMDICADKWDAKQGKACGRTEEATFLNSILDGIKAGIHKHYFLLREKEDCITAEKLKHSFLGFNEKGKTLLFFFQKHNDQYKQKIGNGTTQLTYSRYELTKQRIADFLKKEYKLSDIPIRDIDIQFIERFELYIRRTYDCGNNNAMKYIQKLRTVVNFARNSGLVFIDPFNGYKIHMQKTDRGYLTEEEIHKLMQKELAVKRLEQIRDIFLFACFTGLAYIDIKNLEESHIQTSFDGKKWIITKRQKTNTDVHVPLLEIPLLILQKYRGKFSDNKLFPVLSNQKMNAYLKEIADICGINKNLTFHIARHSFATFTLSKGVPIESVSKMLGHTNITTTQIYARITNNKISEDMQELAKKLEGVEKIYNL